MVELRHLATREVKDLAQLDHEIFGEHSYSILSMRQFYDLAGPLLTVAVEGPSLIGYGLALPSFCVGEGWFMALGVRADHRRAGIGEALASRVLAEAEKLGITTLRLTVEPANQGAIAVYRRLGFELQGITVDYFGLGEDRQIMCRQGPMPDRRSTSPGPSA